MSKKIINMVIAIVFLVFAIGLTGCSGISDEQVAELEALRAEVKSLDSEANSLKDQKASLEKEIADKNSRLDECAKLKAQTQQNLEKLGQ